MIKTFLSLIAMVILVSMLFTKGTSKDVKPVEKPKDQRKGEH